MLTRDAIDHVRRSAPTRLGEYINIITPGRFYQEYLTKAGALLAATYNNVRELQEE